MQKDKIVRVSETQADTYIEWQFEEKCGALKNSEIILNQWRTDKAIFSSKTALTGFDFQHYSLHDKSHSIAILNNIEMILGRQRVDLLNASNLWLLLESAYSHDIGMALTYDELCDIWKDEEFAEDVKRNLRAETADIKKAAQLYDKMCDLLHARKIFSDDAMTYDTEEFEEEFDEIFESRCWPLQCERYIMQLYTEFIRKKHPEKSREFLMRDNINNGQDIPKRMYQCVGNVSFLHGEDFDEIFKVVEYAENGFGAEQMHPQFAAAMLRIGDLLDMDSNRFNIRMLRHMGIVPAKSILHLEKHRAITHLSYSDTLISAEARSEDTQVCVTTYEWFRLLENEVNDLICCWGKMVPAELYGCRMQRCSLKIYLKNSLFDASKETKFEAEASRVYEMLIGENIYSSRLTFIREYLQNALDASKMRLWLELKEKKEIFKNYKTETFTPFDIERSIFENYKIEVGADIDWEKGKLFLTIRDSGIGMEKECVKALRCMAGDNWKKRTAYASEIPEMPVWLRPTGGFGIGIQSAFMLSDHVEIITRSEKENIGRKLQLESTRKGGKVAECLCEDAAIGTKVVIEVGLIDFMKEASANREELFINTISGNVYDKSEIAKAVLHILEKYISIVARHSLVPIRVRCGSEVTEQAGMEWAKGISEKISWLRHKNIQYFDADSKRIVWDFDNDAMIIYSPDNTDETICTYYKGILVKNEKEHLQRSYSMEIDYFSDSVSRYLTVSRENFQREHKNKYHQDLQKYQILFADLYMMNPKNNINEKTIFALNTLFLGKLNYIENIPSNKYKGLLEEAPAEVNVKKIDLDAINTLSILEKAHDDIKTFWNYMQGTILMKTDKLSTKQVLDDVGKQDRIFYVSSLTPPYLVKAERFSVQIRKYKEKRDNKQAIKETLFTEEEAAWYLVQEGAYIITDETICNLLDMCQTSKSYVTQIGTEKEAFNLKIGCYVKDKKAGKDKEYTIKEYFCNVLKKNLHESYRFPLVLASNSPHKDDELGVWISKVFPNVKAYSMQPEEKDVPTGYSAYLLLPLTEKGWRAIITEKTDGGISKEKYDEIVKLPEELKLYIEWTYKYQLGNPKVNKVEIQNRYYKLLDKIYEWLFWEP